MNHHNITIIGAGIVGLATGLKILEKNPDLKILIIEKEDKVAKHQTGNNSGVIHSGIYYKPGSLKAVNCRKGYDMLLQFCDEHDVQYDICGKVITATSEDQLPYLDNLFERGIANGLTGLKKLTEAELKEIEPHVKGIAGIQVHQTGIIDFLEVSKKYAEVLQSKGVEIRLNETLLDIKVKVGGCEVITNKSTHSTDYVVTCAGLQSDRVAKLTHPDLPLRIIPFRGEYYKLKKEKRSLVNNLIYPVPDPAFPFLGVHFTRMIDGEVEAGPNAVLSFKREGYTKTSFSAKDTFETFTWPGFIRIAGKFMKTGLGEFYRSYSKAAFVRALQKLIPEITADDLVPGGAGVRAQACDKNGGLLDDFYFAESERVFHVCNAPSPAATSSLSIGEHIAEKLLKRFS
ncbi:MAG: L-2-hydroxyglutarate oxidase [Bacteroidetes bacterium]|nr:L-2-hydroxyglutarate oxidase [Bacteroidota bacterium]